MIRKKKQNEINHDIDGKQNMFMKDSEVSPQIMISYAKYYLPSDFMIFIERVGPMNKHMTVMSNADSS